MIYIFGFSFSQNNNDTFIFIQDQTRVNHNYVLKKESFSKYRSEIKIDSSLLIEYGKYKVFLISSNNSDVKYYALPDSSALILGNAKGSLKRVELKTGIAAPYNFAKLIADSLRNCDTHFFTDPMLSSKYKYSLSIVAWLDYPDSLNNLEYKAKKDAIDPLYEKFINDFYEEFDFYEKDNIQVYSVMPGDIRILIQLENMEFPFKKLEGFNLTYINSPKVEPRLFHFMILE
jgi:hypothetical protein